MRAALSILGLVVVLAIVLLTAKKQMQQQLPATRGPAAASASAPDALPAPRAVGQQVQGLIDQAAQRASDAQP